MPSKKPARETKAPEPRAQQANAPKPANDPWFGNAARAAAVFVVLIFVAAAMLMASREPAPNANATAAAATANDKTEAAAATTAAASTAGIARTTAGMVSAPVAITGCLEQKDDAFRLKNTEGDDAPKARSWKSGFLKKGSATVAVTDATSNHLKLGSHVGQRVTVTGTLIDREMNAKTLKNLGSCS